MGTSMRPRVADTWFEASISIFSESDGKKVSDILPKNKGSEPAIPSSLGCVQALQKSELTCKLAVIGRVSQMLIATTGSELDVLPTQHLSLCQAECMSSLIKRQLHCSL